MTERVAACVEIGASSVETVLLEPGGAVRVSPGVADVPDDAALLIAVPGLVAGGRVLAASNLDWWDVDPAEQLGLPRSADVVSNDAEAAALGESVLREGTPDLVFIGLGTGVGGAVVRDGRVVEANLFAHLTGYGDRVCGCTRTGCLETVAGGWALPPTLTDEDLRGVAAAVASAVDREPLAQPALVVLAGGLTRAHPSLVGMLAERLPRRVVTPSAATVTKSAAAWGLQALLVQTPA